MNEDQKLEKASDLYRKGIQFNRDKNLPEAVRCFVESCELVPGLAVATLMASLTYVNLGDFPKAREYARKGLIQKQNLKPAEIDALNKILKT